MRVRVDVRGPVHHGAVIHARNIARLLRDRGILVPASGPADVTHTQFTDALWGGDVAAAAAAFTAWSHSVSRPLVATLHDLPGADPDPARDRRRREGYGRVIAGSDAIIVSSLHEAAKVRDMDATAAVHVIELPMPRVPRPTTGPRDARAAVPALAVLGFVYPGKGHADVIDAAGRMPTAPGVVALGAVSPGHERLWRDLQARASDLAVELRITGRLSERDLTAALDRCTVPVVPARLVSASASLVRWLAQGRRPICADGAYSREVDARHPGLIHRYPDPARLDELVATALDHPEATRSPAPPPWPDVGGLHLDVYRSAVETGARRAG